MSKLTLVILLVLGLFATVVSRSEAEELSWIRQFGTTGIDQIVDVATDEAYVYAAGNVGLDQALPEQVSAGGIDTFVRKFDGAGSEIWTRQFGTSGIDIFPALVVHEDEVYVAGFTTGVFPGQTGSGGLDLFIRQYSTSGSAGWTFQFGTTGHETVIDMAADNTALYLFGTTRGQFAGELSAGDWDFFLAKIDFDGNLVWVRQFGTAGIDPAVFLLGGVTVDGNGITVGSTVDSALPGQSGLGDADAFLRRYDFDGNEVWTSQFGTPCRDLLSGVVSYNGALFIAGSSTGDLTNLDFARCANPPITNRNYGSPLLTFVQRRDANGDVAWSQQYQGSEPTMFSLAIVLTVDSSAMYVAGENVGPRDPEAIDPTCPIALLAEDIHVRAFDHQGQALWTQQIGTTATDIPQGIASNDSGIFVGGATECQLGSEPNQGSVDAVLVKIMP